MPMIMFSFMGEEFHTGYNHKVFFIIVVEQ